MIVLQSAVARGDEIGERQVGRAIGLLLLLTQHVEASSSVRSDRVRLKSTGS